MLDYKHRFIELALEKGILKFGSFILKSGRVSPYFFNAGLFCTGEDLAVLGSCYAQALIGSDLKYDVLFGPAYKGIPLACAAAMALADKHNINVPWCFNRKEIKDHGEGGSLVGAKLTGNVVLIDDVITAGTAIYESYDIIKKAGAHLNGAVIAMDREEKGSGSMSAIKEIKEDLGISIVSIITFSDLISYLEDDEILKPHLEAMHEYREIYGAQD